MPSDVTRGIMTRIWTRQNEIMRALNLRSKYRFSAFEPLVLRSKDSGSRLPDELSNLLSRALSSHLEDVEDEAAKVIRCKKCDYDLTTSRLAIEPQGKVFRNALGFSFNLFCYSDAPGTVDIGKPTTEFSWFPGYAWSYAHCAKCGQHLGWWFTGTRRFVGLIANQIIQ